MQLKDTVHFPFYLTSIYSSPQNNRYIRENHCSQLLKDSQDRKEPSEPFITQSDESPLLHLCPKATVSICEQLCVTGNLSPPQTGHYLFRQFLLLESSSLNCTNIRPFQLRPLTLFILSEVMWHKLNPSSSCQSFNYYKIDVISLLIFPMPG